jgi:hypothetical protein
MMGQVRQCVSVRYDALDAHVCECVSAYIEIRARTTRTCWLGSLSADALRLDSSARLNRLRRHGCALRSESSRRPASESLEGILGSATETASWS